MKIIQAMKLIKANKAKINDLIAKIKQHSARASVETATYENTEEMVKGWVQSIHDIGQDNIALQVAIAKTNMVTMVDIDLGGKKVTKSIAEWVWRRREYATIDLAANTALTDRGIKEGPAKLPSGDTVDIKIVRAYDPEARDKAVALYRDEPMIIDSTLEVVNAVTDLME